MTAAVLLDKLDGVKQVARGRWRARCPAHDAKNPNVLSIGETSDGTTLVKCFAGCTAAEVVAAVGLELGDLFPRVEWQSTGAHHIQPRRPRVDWPALIVECERDLMLVKIVLLAVASGEPVDSVDAAACQAGATRVWTLIQEARNG
jgi:hypothetical protein